MRRYILGVALLFSSLAFASDNPMRAGLWEMHMQSDALRNMQAIPPEQQEQLRSMGIAVPKIENNRIVTQVCMPKEMLERQPVPLLDKHQTGCSVENYRRDGQQYSANIICDGPDMKGKGMVKGKMESAEQFESTYEFDGTIEGQPVSHQQTSSGRWLGADCGDVKPITDMGKSK